MEKRTVTKIVRIGLICLSVILVIPLIAFGVCYFWLLTPSVLTPLVADQVNKNITGTFGSQSVELTLRKFPYLGVKVEKAHLLSAKQDTMMVFDEAIVSVKPLDYIFDDVIVLNSVLINGLQAQALIDSANQLNFDIFQASSSDSSSNSLSISLPELVLNDALIVYNDVPSSIFASIMGLDLYASIDLTGDKKKVSYSTGWRDAAFMNYDYVLTNEFKIESSGTVDISDDFTDFDLTDVTIKLDSIPFKIDGCIKKLPNYQLQFDASSSLQLEQLKDVLKYLPPGMQQSFGVKELRGEVLCDAKIKGILSNDSYPVLDMDLKLNDGFFQNTSDYTIDSMIVNMEAHIDYNNNDSSLVKLERIYIKNKDAVVDIHAHVSSLWVNPHFEAELKSNINIDRVMAGFIAKDQAVAKGVIKADLELEANLKDLMNSDFGRISAKGKMSVDNLDVDSKEFDLKAFIKKARLDLSTDTRVKHLNNMQVMSGQLLVDTLRLRYGENLKAEVDYLKLGLGTPAKADTSAIMPIGGKLEYKELKTVTSDSVIFWSNKGELNALVAPWKVNKKKPHYNVNLQADSLFLISVAERSYNFLEGGDIKFDITPHQRRATSGRSRYTQAERDSLIALRVNRQPSDTTLKLDKGASKFLRDWEFNGSISSRRSKTITYYFPLPIVMTGGVISIDPMAIYLKGANFNIGESDLRLTGEIANYRQAFTRGRALDIKLSAQAKYIDCNELLTAVSNGMNFADEQAKNIKREGPKEGQVVSSLDSLLMNPKVEVEGVVQLPTYINLELLASATKMKFKDLEMTAVNGILDINNGALTLKNLKSKSNIGAAELTMFYKPSDKNNAAFGVDLTTKAIRIDKLIELIPSVDTIMPMLKSLEGIVDVSLTAKGDLDSLMSVEFPSFEATANLSGANMVLLDGETFTEIAKKLRMKNKKRNMIDSIATEIMIKDSKIEVFPFLMEMDRYRVAISGQHNLDMTYQYHISVLKSPLPFRIGVNVKGDENDFKIRLGKAKYKDMFKSAKTGVIANTQLNVKEILSSRLKQLLKTYTGSEIAALPTSKVGQIRVDGTDAEIHYDGDGHDHDEEELMILNDSLVLASQVKEDSVKPKKTGHADPATPDLDDELDLED